MHNLFHFVRSGLARSALVASVFIAVACAVVSGSAGAQPLTEVKVSLNAPFDGSNAAFFLAQEKGYFAMEGIAVNLDPSGGSGEVATRIGGGAYDFGFGDINVLLEFNAKNPSSAAKAVYMVYYRSPLAIASFVKSGINAPTDLVGKKIGGSLGDGAYKLFPVYAGIARIKPDSVTWEYGDLRLREAMLLKGDVQAILGFDSTMYFGLVRQGIKPADIKFLYYADAGMNLYGNSIIASKKMLKTKPALVKGFVAASAKGWRDAVANPAAAIAALKKQAPLIDEKLEMEKLQWLIKNQITTAESAADGMGGVRAERLEKSVAVLAKAFDLPGKPKAADVFSSAYLPPLASRKLP